VLACDATAVEYSWDPIGWIRRDGKIRRQIQCQTVGKLAEMIIPIESMYAIFTYIYHKNQPNVGTYKIHHTWILWAI